MSSPSKAKTAKRTSGAAGEEELQLESAPLQDVVSSIAFEIAMARVRHRAVLTILERRGLLDFNEYFDLVMEIRDQDFVPLFMKNVLTPKDYEKHFSGWAENDLKHWSKRGQETAEARSPGLATDPDVIKTKSKKKRT